MELALVVVILGIVVLVAWRHGATAASRQSAAQAHSLLGRADGALRAHAFVHARLPCPAADAQGREACDGRADGFLPHRTLGLPDASAGSIRYRLDAAELAGTETARYRVLVPFVRDVGVGDGDGGLVAERVPLRAIATPGADRTLDLCAALGTRDARDTHGMPDAPGTRGSDGDVAVSMSLPGGPAVMAPAHGQAGSTTRVVRRSRLWSDLSCGALMSTSGRAHFHARLQAAVMRRAIGDYRRQADVARGLTEWDAAQSQWFLANSAYSALKTGIKLDIARSAWLASLRSDPAPATAMGLGTAALATSVLHTSIYASTVARGAFNRSNARANRNMLDRLAGRAQALERDIARRASIGGSNFAFLARQAAELRPESLPWLDATAAAPPAGDSLAREAGRYRDAIGRL